jgi:hypothetical protein
MSRGSDRYISISIFIILSLLKTGTAYCAGSPGAVPSSEYLLGKENIPPKFHPGNDSHDDGFPALDNAVQMFPSGTDGFLSDDSILLGLLQESGDDSLESEGQSVFSVPDTVYVQECDSSMVVVRIIKVVANPKWMGKRTLKWGMFGSFCLVQALTGAIEAYHFNDNDGYLVTEETYHFYETLKRVTWLATGFMTYANLRDANLGFSGKMRRIFGSAFVARNCYDWTYKWQKYNDPFDYSKEHNDKALVYFGIRDGKIVDLYIGTGPKSGPLVDLGFLIGGLLIFK